MGEAAKYYTGVGSRRVPPEIARLMSGLAEHLCRAGWWLRSGGAPGSDAAFERGASSRATIYLPWAGFSARGVVVSNPKAWREAEALVRRPDIYPAAGTRKRSTLRLHARNAFQVLGEDLTTPSRFLVCWTPDGARGRSDYALGTTGGTGIAINIADCFGVPVFNLARPEHRARIESWVDHFSPGPACAPGPTPHLEG